MKAHTIGPKIEEFICNLALHKYDDDELPLANPYVLSRDAAEVGSFIFLLNFHLISGGLPFFA